MLLNLTVKQPKCESGIVATDIGYLLNKNPFTNKVLKFENKLGDTYIFFKKNNPEECVMSVIMDVDNLDLFKKASRGEIQQDSIDHYVHNKSYILSAIFSQALHKVFRSCMSGVCKDQPELVNYKWQVEIQLSTVKTTRLSEDYFSKLFTDLGYEIELEKLAYDSEYEEWGQSNNYNITLKHNSITAQDLFNQIYVLIPVINPDRHFYVDENTRDSLIKKGGDWLSNHPLKDFIVKRYLMYDNNLFDVALEQLKTENEINNEHINQTKLPSEGELEKKESLGEKRHNKILDLIKEKDFRTFVDFGCNDAKLIRRAMKIESGHYEEPEYFKSIIGVDVAHKTLTYQERKMKKEYKDNQHLLDKVNLVVSSLLYQDYRLRNQEVFVLSEVIEHIDLEKHNIVLNNIFNYYNPNMVVMTTPNKDYNKVYEIPNDKMRHRDHRFEWTREEFQKWCYDVQSTFTGYEIDQSGFIGETHEEFDGSCQYVVFTKKENITRKMSDKLLTYNIQKDNGIRLDKLMTSKWIPTRFNQAIEIRKENTIEPLHSLSRFSIPFEQLIYIPPTMSPVESGTHTDYLEYPTDAFKYFNSKGINQVICETKHMGSRMITLICKTEYTAKNLFNLPDGQFGLSWTRSGRRFFKDETTEKEVHEIFHNAITESGLWSQLETEWILLDCEMMPWNYLGEYDLIVKQYADIGCSGLNTLENTYKSILEYSNPYLIEDEQYSYLHDKYNNRLDAIKDYIKSYKNYIWKINSTMDLKIAPFHILATSRNVHDNKNHLWHLNNIDKIVLNDLTGVLKRTDYIAIDLNQPEHILQACQKWEDDVNSGAEGWVIKPLNFLQKEDKKDEYVQPAIKCRGKEYLRIIYGAEYTLPDTLPRLRKRNVKKKRYLAMNEFLLGLEGLHRFSKGNDLENIHECVFGVLSLDSEPVDCRL